MGFEKTIIEWYRDNHRPLPWRETGDPYKIWVSEVILQQTRVDQGLDYYHHFLEVFPDIESLASATEEEVLKTWQGLGYYSRARNMHKAARAVIDKFSGVFPGNYEDLVQLPGIGEYTASAIASIAFSLPFPVMDGNVLRFIARIKGITEPVNTAAGKKIILDFLSKEISKRDPGVFNQAIMEFGAVMCTPRNPQCTRCPFQEICVARNTGNVDKIPVKEKKPLPQPRYFHYLVILLVQDNQVFTLLKQRSGEDIWRNLYEFPMIEEKRLLTWEELIKRPGFKAIFPDNEPGLKGVLKDIRHVLSHRILHARCFIVETGKAPDTYIRISKEQIHNYPMSRLMEKILGELNITFYAKKD